MDIKNNDQDVLLSSSIRVSDYLELERAKDRRAIANFVYNRFAERYIDPFEKQSRQSKHGFSLMAVNCLMIEALTSFRQGYRDTKGKSDQCFKEFFQEAEGFLEFREVWFEFYRNIRCGILHQAESTEGWTIRRCGPLFDKTKLIVNATEFMSRLKEHLKDYQAELEQADWEDEIWQKLRNKMSYIIDNCKGS